MATKEQIYNFIEQIAPVLQREAKARGYKIISPAIAQALQESLSSKSKSGLSQLAVKYHNYHGMKCGKYWLEQGKPSVNMKTNEEYKVGTLTPITDFFRVYSDMESGLVGYYDFLDMKRYAKVRLTSTPKEYMEEIKAVGYCTSSTYVKNCLTKIDKYNLTHYDNITVEGGKLTETKRATLRCGDYGENVVYLQTRLAAMGYGVGKIDGIFGIKTLEAVKMLQIDKNLVVDGIVGQKTWAAL